jgi:hypothetical protein
MKDVRGAVPVGQRNDDQLVDRFGEQRPYLCDAVVVGAVAMANRNRPVVEPDDISAFQ